MSTFYVKENNKINIYSININEYQLLNLKKNIDIWDGKGVLRNKKNITYFEYEPHFLSNMCSKFIKAKSSLEITKLIFDLNEYLEYDHNANEICFCKDLLNILKITKLDENGNKLLEKDINNQINYINDFWSKIDKTINKKEQKSIHNNILNTIPEYSSLYLIMN